MRVLNLLMYGAVCALLLLSTGGAAHAHRAAPIDEGLALHLVNRLGYGPAPGEVARVRGIGVRAHVDSQLAPPPMPPRLQAQLRELAEARSPAGEQALLRAIASPRQLEEVLVAFWLDYLLLTDDGARAALRPLVLGRYATLRAAIDAVPRQGPLAGGGEAAAREALVRHFVSAPSAALQRAVARVWKANGGDQRAVLRMLLTSREFLAPRQWNSKRKDGFRFVVSAVRASGVAVENVAPLAQWIREGMTEEKRADFIERLAGGQLALAMAPVRPHQHASSAPPLRATAVGKGAQGTVAQPGPVLMAAPTPSAAAMAAAAGSQPAEPGRLRELLRREDFLRY
ncbi:MAG: DUF1800 family protein [Lysobacteraceae bacterium]|nr:MAG: DUF1800 family protein [Xanthomonadaceae bacterium]